MRGVILWAKQDTANLGVAALAAGTHALASSVWPDGDFATQYYSDGPAPRTIASPKLLLRDSIVGGVGLREWISGYSIALDTRMGDSFADIYGNHRLTALAAMGEFVRRNEVPLALTPQTIGPFRTRRGRILGALSARRADLVLCRDPVSAEVASDLGACNVVLTTDVVFALEVPEAIGSHDVLLNVSGLLWNSDSHGPSAQYRQTVSDLVQRLRTDGRQVTLLAHVLDSPELDNDVPVVRELGTQWGLPVAVPSSLAEVRGLIRGANLVIGSRMHACLNSLSVGTPAVALAYSRKFSPLLAAVGWEAVVGLDEAKAADRAYEHVTNPDLPATLESLRARTDDLLGRARTALRELLPE